MLCSVRERVGGYMVFFVVREVLGCARAFLSRRGCRLGVLWICT